MVQTLVQSLDSLENDTGAEPTSMKYQASLADQVPYWSPPTPLPFCSLGTIANPISAVLLSFNYLLRNTRRINIEGTVPV